LAEATRQLESDLEDAVEEFTTPGKVREVMIETMGLVLHTTGGVTSEGIVTS
jgi:hypothetical protein